MDELLASVTEDLIEGNPQQFEDNSAEGLYTDLSAHTDYLCTHITRDFTPEERELYEIHDTEPTCARFAG